MILTWCCIGSTESYASNEIQSNPVNATLIHLNDWLPAGSPQPVIGHLVSHSNQHQAGQFKFPRIGERLPLPSTVLLIACQLPYLLDPW